MTRWMLLALLACAAAQDVDRLQEATRALEKAAKDTKSPMLAALALKSATVSGDSALTKVIKFIDEAYNTIQKQIEKETAANTRCVNLTAESQHKLDKLNRDRMNFEGAESQADTDRETAKTQHAAFQAELDDNQNTRSATFEAFEKTKGDFDGEIEHLDHNKSQLTNVQNKLADAASSEADQTRKEHYAEVAQLFETIVARVDEQLTTAKADLRAESKEFQAFTEQDERDKKNLNAGINNQAKRQADASKALKEAKASLLETRKSLSTEESLRKDIDAECVKTTVNVKDRAAQRQSEIDSLKQVKEILSQ